MFDENQKIIFSSPELKDQVNFSEYFLSGVRLSVYRQTQIQPNLSQGII